MNLGGAARKSRPDVDVTLAGEAQRPLIAALFQFYAYDFSELEPADSSDFELDKNGRFGPYAGLADYWATPGRAALLIRVGDRPAGFALINTHSHRGGAVERNMAEFFVARKHRRHGVGRAAARQIFALYPGRWEVAVVERNAAAQAFWPRAITAAPNVSGLTRLEGDGERWRGPIWAFHAYPDGQEGLRHGR